ncbi:MAG: M23 family metallopeptidase [Acutalibacteraceae bacterium]
MSELSNLIFHNAKHYISSPYGKREVISTSAGNTSSFHNGVDYATYGLKLPQYAIANGSIISCGTDWAYGGAKYVWVKYPDLGVKMLHYHLDSIAVKSGQAVNQNTVLGCTGKTGKATGIHLHLGLKLLSGGDYIDPEKWWKESNPLCQNVTSSVSEEKNSSVKKYLTGNYKVTKANVLNVRTGAGTSYTKKTYSQLTADAQKKILTLAGYKANGYVKGLTFTVSEVKDNWGKTPSGWVCLDYCEKI